MSLSLVRPTAPRNGRVGSADDVLAPRPRLSLRRAIMAVIVPGLRRARRRHDRLRPRASRRRRRGGGVADPLPVRRRGRHRDRRRPADPAPAPRGPWRPPGPAAGDGLPRDRGLRPPRLPHRRPRPRCRLGAHHPQARPRGRPGVRRRGGPRVGPPARPPAARARRPGEPVALDRPVVLQPPGAARDGRQRPAPVPRSRGCLPPGCRPVLPAVLGPGRSPGRHRGADLERVLPRARATRAARRAGRPGTPGDGDHRGVPAQRGRHHRGDPRGVPAPASTPAVSRSSSPTTPPARWRSSRGCS